GEVCGVGEAGVERAGAGGGDHAVGVVDGDDGGAGGDEAEGEGAVAAAEVEDSLVGGGGGEVEDGLAGGGDEGGVAGVEVGVPGLGSGGHGDSVGRERGCGAEGWRGVSAAGGGDRRRYQGARYSDVFWGSRI